jgi:hypothetical protein
VNIATNFIVTGVRPGVGDIELVRVGFESQVGFFLSNTVAYTDTVITNGQTISQGLSRPLAAPDIIFEAGDLQQETAFDGGKLAALVTNGQDWITNGVPEFAEIRVHYGPGIIPPADATPQFTYTMNSVGQMYLNSTPFALSEALGTQYFRWGSFDGSTNTPVIYPQSESIRAIEDQVLGGGSEGSGEGGGASVGVWTPAASVLLPVGTNLGGGTTGDPNAGATTP